jgi:hypothetical protein
VREKSRAFYSYKGGIYDPPHSDCWGWPNHTILLVGYGFDEAEQKEYWIFLNSWGTDWGDGGYGKMAIGAEKDGGCGTCGHLCDYITWPEIEAKEFN